MKKIFGFLFIKNKKLNENGIFLPYTMFFVSILIIFFMIQIDVIQSYKVFFHLSSTQNKLERAYIHSLFDLKNGKIPLQIDVIKYYNGTKIKWDFKKLSNDEYNVTLTSSNSKIKKHVIQFRYNKAKNQVSDWTD